MVFGNIRTVKLCFHGFKCELQAIICFQCWSCLPGIQFFIHCLKDNKWRCILVPFYSAAIRVVFWSNWRCEPVKAHSCAIPNLSLTGVSFFLGKCDKMWKHLEANYFYRVSSLWRIFWGMEWPLCPNLTCGNTPIPTCWLPMSQNEGLDIIPQMREPLLFRPLTHRRWYEFIEIMFELGRRWRLFF